MKHLWMLVMLIESIKFWFKVDNLKIMPGSYDVEVSSKKISHFTNTKLGVQYWIALEPESSYND